MLDLPVRPAHRGQPVRVAEMGHELRIDRDLVLPLVRHDLVIDDPVGIGDMSQRLGADGIVEGLDQR